MLATTLAGMTMGAHEHGNLRTGKTFIASARDHAAIRRRATHRGSATAAVADPLSGDVPSGC